MTVVKNSTADVCRHDYGLAHGVKVGKKKLFGDFLEILEHYTRSEDLGNLKGCLLELKAT